jgi:hypothetical protein
METLLSSSWFPMTIGGTPQNGGFSLDKALIDTICLSAEERNNLTSLGYFIDPQSRWVSYNSTLKIGNDSSSVPFPLLPEDAPFPESLLARGCMYMIDDAFVQGFYDYFLNQLFKGTAIGTYSTSGTLSFYSGPQVLQHLYNAGYNDFDWVDSIFNNASIALTNYIRQNGQMHYSRNAIGEVSHFAICVDIQWPWITLPAALGILTVILLILSIVANRRKQTPIWKSSPLALFFHGPSVAGQPNQTELDDYSAQPSQTEDFNTIAAMKDAARSIHVWIDNSKDSIRLAVKQGPPVPQSWVQRFLTELRI